MRLVFQTGGGFVADTFAFTNPRGNSFLAIDGTCHFYVNGDYSRGGIHSGALSSDDADALARDLHWRELGNWTWGPQDEPCADAGGVMLLREGRVASCSCGCDASAPNGLAEALEGGYAWLTRLRAAGMSLDGAVSALAFESSESPATAARVRDWPLSRPLSAIPNLIQTRHDPKVTSGPYARFDNADASELRDLRAKGSSTMGIGVRDAGKVYLLLVRDELPDATAKAWDALNASIMSRP